MFERVHRSQILRQNFLEWHHSREKHPPEYDWYIILDPRSGRRPLYYKEEALLIL